MIHVLAEVVRNTRSAVEKNKVHAVVFCGGFIRTDKVKTGILSLIG